jgi:hypothetical protein
MSRLNKTARLSLICAVALFGGIGGCTKKPSQEELTKLEEAKAAAESAERKLAELRQERMRLEQDLQNKQGDLQNQENERSSMKEKVGN